MIKLWLGFSLLYLVIGIFNYWRYTMQTFLYTVLLWRESTQSSLQLEWRLPNGMDEEYFIDSTVKNEYPDWEIGWMSIEAKSA